MVFNSSTFGILKQFNRKNNLVVESTVCSQYPTWLVT